MNVTLHHGDCLAVLRTLDDASVDAIVTDPPYGLAEHKPATLATTLTAWLNGDREHVPDGRGFMSKKWDAFVPPPAVWDECLRVLKPGGHMLVFAGSRTVDLMGLSIRLAGFELRDEIMWCYGSGFPKSLDVSKAIDKAAGAQREVVGTRRSEGGRTTTPGAEGQEGNHGHASAIVDITAAATDAAKQWAGFGTALKPGHEPILVCRKPLTSAAINVLKNVELALRERGVEGSIEWTNAPVSDAGRRSRRTNSGSTPPPRTGATSARNADASETQSEGPLTASSSAQSTQPGERQTVTTCAPTSVDTQPTCGTPSLTPTAEPAHVAASASESSSPSTTSMAAEARTEKQSTARSTSSFAEKDSLPAIESFAGIATGLTGSRAAVHIDRLADGTFLWPDGLPRSVPGGSSTVAANVQEHGTGALNIDACRVRPSGAEDEAAYRAKCASVVGLDSNRNGAAYGEWTGQREDSASDQGRWPANVVLVHSPDCDQECAEGCPVAEMDQQSGISKDGVAVKRNRNGEQNHHGIYGSHVRGAADDQGYGGSGGASRYFPSFKYQAKAASKERPKVDGQSHPTVKPLALMRWLVKLVGGQPGSLILDPFAGTGTTGQAAQLEGFASVLIERDELAVRLIAERLSISAKVAPLKPELPVQVDMFELLDEEAS